MFKATCIFCSVILFGHNLIAQIVIEEKYAVEELVEKVLIGKQSGIKIEQVKYTGHKNSIGSYATFTRCLPIPRGVVLSTGWAKDVDGPNESSNKGTKVFTGGDKQLQNLIQKQTMDAAVLEFVFYPNTNEISFEYFFASEEYPEYVNKGVNDVFAFFISGPGYDKPQNLALIPETDYAVSVDNVNAFKNQKYYIENMTWNPENLSVFKNKPDEGERAYNCEFDGMTVALKATAKVLPFKPYVLKFAIADVGDHLYDSGVFIKKGSLKSRGDTLPLISVIEQDLKNLDDSLKLIRVAFNNDEIKIVSNIQFDFNSHEIGKEYKVVLSELTELFQRYFDSKIKIVGHSDSIGDEHYNQSLSEKRAQEIYEYFLSKGIMKNRLAYVGKGNTEPIYKGNNNEKKAINRRVEFILH